ncbi:MAG: hypothetical protein I8H75_03870 [Myxococcaceae bacterium]|nr:hypothetical protein [Myxococcaceae bacterium]
MFLAFIPNSLALNYSILDKQGSLLSLLFILGQAISRRSRLAAAHI